MNFEKISLMDQNVVEKTKKENSKKEGGVDLRRRDFLKKSFAAVAGATSALIVKDPIFNAVDSLIGNEEEGKTQNQETSEPVSVSKPVENNLEQEEAGDAKTREQEKGSENEKQKPKEKLELLFDKLAYAHEQIKKNKKLWNKSMFPETFLIAQEMIESGIDGSKVSSAGAVGVCQIRPISVKASLEYLRELNKKNIVSFDFYEELSDKDMAVIMERVKNDDDFNRMFRDFYLSYLGPNGVYGPNIGEYKLAKKQKTNIRDSKKEDKKIEESRKKILEAYNVGPTAVKKLKPQDLPTETKLYPVKIENFHKTILKVKEELIAKGEDAHPDAIRKIVSEAGA